MKSLPDLQTVESCYFLMWLRENFSQSHFFFLIRALTSFESVYLLDLITSKRLHFLIHGDGGGGDVRIIHTNFERTQTFSM